MFGIDDAVLMSVGGSLLGGFMRNRSQEDQSDKQMAFQERMSSTAHQREVEDLVAAGLNPMLSAKLGGASSPAGSQAQISDIVSPAVSSGQQAKMLTAQLEQIKSQTALNEANAATARADMWLKNAQVDNVNAQTGQSMSQTGLNDVAAARMAKEILQILAQTRLTNKDVEVRGEDVHLRRAQTASEAERVSNIQADTGRALAQTNLAMQDRQLREVETLLKKLDIPASVAQSKFYEGAVGEQSPMIRLVMQLISVLNRFGR